MVLDKSLVLAAVVLVLAVEQTAADEPPPLKILADAVPSLSNSNGKTTRLRFTLELSYEFVRFTSKCFWRAPNDFRMIVTTGKKSTPVVFLANRKMMIFDVATKQLLIVNEARSRITVKATDANVRIDHEVEQSKNDSEVKLDLRSFLNNVSLESARIEKNRSGGWRLTAPSTSGEESLQATFDGNAPHRMRSVELRTTGKESQLFFSLRDISVDEEINERWPAFPKVDSIPKGIKVVHASEIKGNTFNRVSEFSRLFFRTISAQAAIETPKLRELPILRDVDWQEAASQSDKYGPELKSLLRIKIRR